mgnify:FL=1
MEKIKKTLAQAIKDGSVPQYNRKMSKWTARMLTAISVNLPRTQMVARLKRATGAELIEDGVETNDGVEINLTEEYTVFENVPTKVNHLKRLKKAYEMSNSPLEVIFYGFKFIQEDYRNEWISIVNDAFNTDYPPAYLDDVEGEESESA